MLAVIQSHGLHSAEGFAVEIEVDINKGMPTYNMVGLPDAAVKEARDRITSAIKNSRYEVPGGHITINLAPAAMKKVGSIYDLPIALGMLCASGQILALNASGFVVFGELALNGSIRAIPGVLPMVLDAYKQGKTNFIVPPDNADDVTCIDNVNIYAPRNLREAAEILCGSPKHLPCKKSSLIVSNSDSLISEHDFSLIRGQHNAKRAAEIAAAGGHNMLLIGTPGSGKTMLAQSIPTILPDMTEAEAIEVTRIHSIASTNQYSAPQGLIPDRPFRCPHHTASAVSIIGGGSSALPGEISLAHNGVLFLDEFPEFKREVTEALRQPLEDGKITITRAAAKSSYPARFMLVAAMNPCPCGYFGSKRTECRCSHSKIESYLQRISGPMLDRIDLHIEMPEVDFRDFTSEQKSETSATIRKRVNAARALQQQRYESEKITCNAQMTSLLIGRYCDLSNDAKRMMSIAYDKLTLSARAYQRLHKVARTIADLDGSEKISELHVSEALQYRSIVEKYWKG